LFCLCLISVRMQCNFLCSIFSKTVLGWLTLSNTVLLFWCAAGLTWWDQVNFKPTSRTYSISEICCVSASTHLLSIGLRYGALVLKAYSISYRNILHYITSKPLYHFCFFPSNSPPHSFPTFVLNMVYTCMYICFTNTTIRIIYFYTLYENCWDLLKFRLYRCTG